MGRAPTSGNCHTCRQRRVKCDKTRPACERCTKAGYDCAGYESVLRIESHAIVAGDAPGTSRLAKIQNVSSFPDPEEQPSSRRAKKRKSRRDQQSSGGSGSQTRSSSVTDTTGTLMSSRGTGSRSPSPEISLAGFVDDISFTYFFHSYGWINMHSILLQDAHMRSHLADEDMAYDSLRALSYGLLGRDHKIPSLQESAQKLYGNALRLLGQKLATSSKTELARLIKPIAIMGSYSITVERDLRFTHHRGLARILEYCGPEYFQSPSLLAIFESARFTLISNAIVRRQATFLAKPEWKTVPWALSLIPKSATNRILDVATGIPGIIHGVTSVMRSRLAWLLSGCAGKNPEQPGTVPTLIARSQLVEAELALWRTEWEMANPTIAPTLMEWVFRRAETDNYRPGIGGFHGPDVFDANVFDTLTPEEDPPWPAGLQPVPDPALFTALQDVALYTTVLVWTTRLSRYLADASRSPVAVDFFNAPFHSRCNCCTPVPNAGSCETVPPAGHPGPPMDPRMNWNASACSLAVAPTRLLLQPQPQVPPSPTAEPPALLLIPGDVRFASQLRVLAFLCGRLPAARPQVLATLAAIGLAHCGHDVRPLEGIREVTRTVERVLARTGVSGATDVLLKSYRELNVGQGETGYRM